MNRKDIATCGVYKTTDKTFVLKFPDQWSTGKAWTMHAFALHMIWLGLFTTISSYHKHPLQRKIINNVCECEHFEFWRWWRSSKTDTLPNYFSLSSVSGNWYLRHWTPLHWTNSLKTAVQTGFLQCRNLYLWPKHCRNYILTILLHYEEGIQPAICYLHEFQVSNRITCMNS